MKLIASDYDNTFYINDEDIKKNNKAVNEFMKNNIFVIATGRSYFDFNNMSNLYNINANYQILNHGATIVKNDNVIYNFEIDSKIKDQIAKIVLMEEPQMLFTCSSKESRLKLSDNNLTKIHVTYNSISKAKKIYDIIMENFASYVNVYFVKDTSIEIVSKNADKAKGIEMVAKLENIDIRNIYTIGDSYTDISMIERFKGYSMLDSVEEVRKVSNKEYSSVSNFIMEVQNGKI